MTSASASSQSVWNDCEDSVPLCSDDTSLGAGGGGYSLEWPATPGQPVASGPDTTPCGLGTCRAVPDFSYPADPSAGGVAAYWDGRWTPFGGTSVAAPTNAGLFVDTNQGCYSPLGRVGPALYAAQQANGDSFTDITQGNNDFTDTNAERFAAATGFDPASGLGTPVDSEPGHCAARCGRVPVGRGRQPRHGTGQRRRRHHDRRGRLRQRHLGHLRVGGRAAAFWRRRPPPSPSSRPTRRPPSAWTSRSGTRRASPRESAADHYGFGGNLNCGEGYRFVASDGGVFDFGDAAFWGSAGGMSLNAPVVGMADTPSSNGYWLVASDGGIFNYGDAGFFGSMGGRHLNKPIVGIAATPDGGGYWMVASDGGIFSFGNAQFFGSTGGMSLNKPIVGMAATPDGGGYWLVASDGGIFAYGDAQFYGSTGSLRLNSPVVGMASGPGGNGYWLVAADGGIFAYGRAQFFGSAGSLHLNKPVVGMAAAPDSQGYWLVASDGGIFTYGNTLFYGSTGGTTLNKPIVGMSSA